MMKSKKVNQVFIWGVANMMLRMSMVLSMSTPKKNWSPDLFYQE